MWRTSCIWPASSWIEQARRAVEPVRILVTIVSVTLWIVVPIGPCRILCCSKTCGACEEKDPLVDASGILEGLVASESYTSFFTYMGATNLPESVACLPTTRVNHALGHVPRLHMDALKLMQFNTCRLFVRSLWLKRTLNPTAGPKRTDSFAFCRRLPFLAVGSEVRYGGDVSGLRTAVSIVL
eukprot:1895366-Amphidinium_carterae.1